MRLSRCVLVLAALLAAGSGHAIVGGQPARAADAAWTLALADRSKPYTRACRDSGGSRNFCQQVCAAVAIAPQWALTAAHCLIGREAANLRVIANAANLNASTDAGIRVTALLRHPQAPTVPATVYNNDLALLQLETALAGPFAGLASPDEFTALVDTAADRNDEVELLGWGRLSNTGAFPARLQQVALDLQPPLTADLQPGLCESTYPTLYNASTMTCAAEFEAGAIEPDDAGDSTPRDKDGEDSCSLDSGGPLVSRANGVVRVLGLVSWGQDGACGSPDFPGVYTRVPAYAAWLEQTTATAGDALTDLAVAISGVTSAAPGAQTLTVTLRNDSADAASDISGAGLHISVAGTAATSLGATTGISCVAAGDGYDCTVSADPMPVGASATVALDTNGSADTLADISVTVQRGAGQGDYRAHNDSARHRLAYTAAPDLRTQLLGAVTQYRKDDGVLWLFVDVVNASAQVDATGVTFAVTAPTGHVLAGSGALACTGTRAVSCDLGTLAAGATLSTQLRFTSAKRRDGTLAFSASAGNGDFPADLDGKADAAGSAKVRYLDPAAAPRARSVGADNDKLLDDSDGLLADGGGATLPLLLALLLALRRAQLSSLRRFARGCAWS